VASLGLLDSYAAAVTGREFDEWGFITAVAGLRGAYRRFQDAHRETIPFQNEAAASAVELVNWACTLDEQLKELDPSGYTVRRDADKDGRVLLALRFARDRHIHQMVVSVAIVFTVGWSEAIPPTLTSARICWRDLADLREPNDKWRVAGDYPRRRAAYQSQLEGREAIEALVEVHRFLNREVVELGIEGIEAAS
jgi:hypothetical protein